MIYIDNRIGSKELQPYFPKKLTTLTTLEYGDVMFLGVDEHDNPTISVGIERKRINDLITSMTSGRLSGYQIPGMRNCYTVVYLIVEGLWRPNPRDGLLEFSRAKSWTPLTLGARTFMAREIYNYLNSLQILCGVCISRTGSIRETSQLILSLYKWWTDKSIDAHKSHIQTYSPYVDLSTKRPPLMQRIVAELPGIGLKRSKRVSEHFGGSIYQLMTASKEKWMEIEGIGKTLANTIINALHYPEKGE